MGALIDIAGQRFGRLIVIKMSHADKDKFIRWECLCDCGNVYFGRSYELRNGIVKSCGCLERENINSIANRTIHGLSKLPIYKVWKSMKSRCYNKSDKRYSRYGGRGIDVCKEWINDPKLFVEWSLNNGYKAGLSIDRKDNDKGYSPDNCRFITIAENNRNTSNTNLTNSDIKKIKSLYKGGNSQISIAKMFNITQQTVSKIINNKSWKYE